MITDKPIIYIGLCDMITLIGTLFSGTLSFPCDILNRKYLANYGHKLSIGLRRVHGGVVIYSEGLGLRRTTNGSRPLYLCLL